MALGCAIGLFLVSTRTRVQTVWGNETSFLEIETRFAVQLRRECTSPGDVLVAGLLTSALVLLVVGAGSDVDPRIAVVLWTANLHFRVFPHARRQALVVADHLDGLRLSLGAINHLEGLAVGYAVAALMLHGVASTWLGPHGLAILAFRPRTLHPGNLTSTSRDGVVDDHWIRTAHTDTHWVITIRQPIVVSIPRSDTDLADVVMVLLYGGRRSNGRRYLDQARIGRIFRLSRQKTGDRIRLYKRDHRIEDVLGRGRHNHHLNPPMVNAIHGMILEDPFLGASEIRRRLGERGLLSRTDAISLTTITEAIKSVDYVAVRWKIQEMLRRGELVPDYQNICGILLREMADLAETAGRKVGQQIIPIAKMLDPNAGGLSPPGVPTRNSEAELETLLGPAEPGAGILASGWRASFVHYFSFGASYREIASFLGVHASTVYRRLVSIRRRLPALAKALGPLRYSGVVGIDEKYILAPKPHREGMMARWVYLFIAIDPYSYDLLHAEVYPARNTDCARAFLVGLKASGVLAPKVIVTDLWSPYETVIPEAYPGVTHHQCVFHAEQAASTMMRDKLGKDYRSIPEAEALRKAIISVFRAGCRRTLVRRYGKLLQQKDVVVTRCPDLAPVFEALARHFEKLANAYADHRVNVPHTNNAAESIFRCFTRRYKTLSGFETLETARAYVKLWAAYYRFRPFSPAANQRIRNKSPLQIAGYEVQGLTCLDLVMPPPQVEARS